LIEIKKKYFIASQFNKNNRISSTKKVKIKIFTNDGETSCGVWERNSGCD
jgi:hypothetical protein